MSSNSIRAFACYAHMIALDPRVVATRGAPRIVYKHIHYRKGFVPRALAPSRDINGLIKRVSSAYASFSTKRPYVAAGITAASIFMSADLFAQRLEGASAMDYRRTFAVASFGFIYYGGPLKFFYLLYDKMFTSVAMKVLADVGIHTPFFLIPMFYVHTLTIKGKSRDQMLKQLKDEWTEASFGSLCFWGPTCALNFTFVPQHSRILVVAVMSFFHKTWLSWVSNRKRVLKLQLAKTQAHPARKRVAEQLAKAQVHPARLLTSIGSSPSSLPASLPFSTAV